MAKKTVKKKVEPKFSEAERLFLDNSHRLDRLEARLDRIVAAASKAKPITKDM